MNTVWFKFFNCILSVFNNNKQNSVAVYHSVENLPLSPFDGRVVDTACGAELNMNRLASNLKATTAGEIMTVF